MGNYLTEFPVLNSRISISFLEFDLSRENMFMCFCTFLAFLSLQSDCASCLIINIHEVFKLTNSVMVVLVFLSASLIVVAIVS